MASRTQPVHSVTTAQRGLSDDIGMRTRRYLITMGVRTGCFLAAIVVDGPARWVLIVLAVVLPYFGVVGANAGRERNRDVAPEAVRPQVPALESAPLIPTVTATGDITQPASGTPARPAPDPLPTHPTPG